MASGNDMKAAESTSGGFLTLLRITIPVVVVLTAIIIALIA